ncbi:MAG: glycogen synthase GlgA, partial [Gemmatimonadales bacterium]
PYTTAAFEEAGFRALATFTDRPRWLAMMRAGMARDFSWERSVATYLEVYRRTLASRAAAAR